MKQTTQLFYFQGALMIGTITREKDGEVFVKYPMIVDFGKDESDQQQVFVNPFIYQALVKGDTTKTEWRFARETLVILESEPSKLMSELRSNFILSLQKNNAEAKALA